MKGVSDDAVRASKLMEGPSYTDQAFVKMRDDCVRGSRKLAAAVLRTGKMYGPMSEAKQIEAIEYAYGVKAVLKNKAFIR